MKPIEKMWLKFAGMVPFGNEKFDAQIGFYAGAATVMQLVKEFSEKHKGNTDLVNLELGVVQKEITEFTDKLGESVLQREKGGG